jgi:hypothetical protein
VSGLKKIILIVVIFLGAWSYYQKKAADPPSIELTKPNLAEPIPAQPNLSQPNLAIESNQKDQQTIEKSESRFKCDGREYCGQMTSRAEAEFFLRNCPNTKMDGDNDGIPCENDSRF